MDNTGVEYLRSLVGDMKAANVAFKGPMVTLLIVGPEWYDVLKAHWISDKDVPGGFERLRVLLDPLMIYPRIELR